MEEFWHKILMANFYLTFKISSELELSNIVLAIFMQTFQASSPNLAYYCSLFSFRLRSPQREGAAPAALGQLRMVETVS